MVILTNQEKFNIGGILIKNAETSTNVGLAKLLYEKCNIGRDVVVDAAIFALDSEQLSPYVYLVAVLRNTNIDMDTLIDYGFNKTVVRDAYLIASHLDDEDDNGEITGNNLLVSLAIRMARDMDPNRIGLQYLRTMIKVKGFAQ